jgi:hypothetical protein
MVNLDYGLFTRTSKNYYFFNRESWVNPRHLQFFEFIGKLFALSCIKQGYFLSPSFSSVIYKMILEEKVEVEDLVEEFDEGEVIKNVEKLKEFTDDSMFWQTFIYEDVRMITDKPIKRAGELEKEGKNFYLLKEANNLKEKPEGEVESSRVIKVTKVGETIELVPGGA